MPAAKAACDRTSTICHAIRRSARHECRSAPGQSIANAAHLRNGSIDVVEKRDRSVLWPERHKRAEKQQGFRHTTLHRPRFRHRHAAEVAAKTRENPSQNAPEFQSMRAAAGVLKRVHAPPEHSSFASLPPPIYPSQHSQCRAFEHELVQLRR